AKYRNLQFRAQRGQALNMIAVFVGYENAVQTFRCAANREESIADLPAAEARVDEQACFVGFDIGAIAGGAAAENRKLNGHAPTLGSQNFGGNPFARRPTRSPAGVGCEVDLCPRPCWHDF